MASPMETAPATHGQVLGMLIPRRSPRNGWRASALGMILAASLLIAPVRPVFAADSQSGAQILAQGNANDFVRFEAEQVRGSRIPQHDPSSFGVGNDDRVADAGEKPARAEIEPAIR